MKAVIDIGTNSVRLLVTEFDQGSLIPVYRDLAITRLGQGVDESGRLDKAAMERTIQALVGYKRQLSQYSLDDFALMATSAVRDASNRGEFVACVQECTGWVVEILSGDAEAALSFQGAIKTLPDTVASQTVWVIDIGGGSTELIRGTPQGKVLSGGSAQVGAVRMTERFIRSHPVSQGQLTLMEETTGERLTELVPGGVTEALLVAVGGTATTLAAIHLGLTKYCSEIINGTILSQDQIQRMYHGLAAMTIEERLQVRGLMRGREDVIVAGAGILLTAMQLLNCASLRVSDYDLLHGRIYQFSAKGYNTSL